MAGSSIAAIVAGAAALSVGAGVVTVIAVTAVVAVIPQPVPEYVVVSRVVDGDTVDVQIDGREERIRLLNIDTPESVDPNREVECLGLEATEFLAMSLPAGTVVTLEYDQDRTDRYGRTLAGVFMTDGIFVNAEIARLGLGHAVVVGENDRFFDEVDSAQDEARTQARGLFSPEIACTVPSQVDQLVNQAATVPTTVPPGATSAELATAASLAAAAVVAAHALRDALDGESHVWRALPPTDRIAHARRIESAIEETEHKSRRLHVAATKAERREVAAAVEAARVAEEQRLAADVEVARLAAEAEAQRIAAVDAAARAKAAAAKSNASTPVTPSAPAPAPAPAPTSQPATDPYPGYTGPRCYAPGGKTWKPC